MLKYIIINYVVLLLGMFMECTILNLKNVAWFFLALVCLLFVNFLNVFIYFMSSLEREGGVLIVSANASMREHTLRWSRWSTRISILAVIRQFRPYRLQHFSVKVVPYPLEPENFRGFDFYDIIEDTQSRQSTCISILVVICQFCPYWLQQFLVKVVPCPVEPRILMALIFMMSLRIHRVDRAQASHY